MAEQTGHHPATLVVTAHAPRTPSPDLVRLLVAWSGHHAELVLPTQVPLGELLPAIAAVVDALDAEEVHRGCALLDSHGGVLDPESGLGDQGVRNGDRVTLVLGLGARAEVDDVVYDDLAEAVAAALVAVSPAWGDNDSRSSSLLRGGLGLTGGALVLGWHHSPGPVVGVAAAGASALLLMAGVMAVRRRALDLANLLLLAAGPYAAVAGLAVAASDTAREYLFGGLALALTAGVALSLARGMAAAAPPSGPSLSILTTIVPSVVGGSFAALVGTALILTSLPVDRVVSVDLVGLVILGVAVPRIVVPTTDAGHRLALAALLGIDLVMAASAPVVVTGGGWAGLGLVGVGGLLQAYRTQAVIRDIGGTTLVAVAVSASLAGPVLASVTALTQLSPLLPPLLPSSARPSPPLSSPLFQPEAWGSMPAWALAVAIVVVTATAVVAPILVFLRAEPPPMSTSEAPRGRPESRPHSLLGELVAVSSLVALLVVMLGLVRPVGVA